MLDPATLNRLREARAMLIDSLVDRSMARLALALKRWNPDQPRVPAGGSEGGRWLAAREHLSTISRDDRNSTPVADRVASGYSGSEGQLLHQFDMGGYFRCIYDFGSDRMVTDFPGRMGGCPASLDFMHPSIQTGDFLNDNFKR